MDSLRDQVINNDLLLALILDNLSGKELVPVCLVARRWYSIVLSVLRSRNSENMLLMHFPRNYWVNFEPKTQGKVLLRTQEVLLEMVHNCSNIVKIADKETARKQVMDTVHNRLKTIPGCVLTYTSCWKMTQDLRMKSIFPKSTYEIYLHSSQGVICTPEIKTTFELERDRDFYRVESMASCVLSKHFSDNKITLTNWWDPDSPRPAINDPDYPLKCIIYIGKTFNVDKDFTSFCDQIPYKIALGGVFVSKVRFRDHADGNCKESPLLTLAFSGKNVKAASIVFNDRLDKKYESNRLEDFRKSLSFNPDQRDSDSETIGFLFICAGRGRYYYDKKDQVESTILKKVFPKILFTGVFGQGEYGHNYYNNESIESPCDQNCQDRHHLSYTSVVVLINFAKG